MQVKQAMFTGSFPKLSLCPKPIKPEYAFIGRSNVGKSSLINMLCGRKQLAKTSANPGKTQLLNYFLINENWFLVDLPGYGYAKVSKTKRKQWEKMIREYIVQRESLMNVFLLIDGTIPPQQIDIDFINWLGEMRIAFTLLFTKTDRLKTGKRSEFADAFLVSLSEFWDPLPPHILTSAKSSDGQEEILTFIDETNGMFKP